MPIDWPDGLYQQSESWGMVYNDRTFEAMNNSQQVVDFPGAYWEASLTFDKMDEGRERSLTALLGQLRGRTGICRVPAVTRVRTDNIGAVVVVSASAMAYSLRLGGITPGMGFREGDYITVGGELLEVVEPVLADLAGEALVQINRRLRLAHAIGTPVEYRNPYCVMRLSDPRYAASRRPMQSSMTLKFREAF